MSIPQKWRNWARMELNRYRLHYFYYLSMIDNFESILKHGILSKNKTNQIETISFAESGVQERRSEKKITLSGGRTSTLHELVPLYIRSKTPTLFSRKQHQNDMFICLVSSSILWDSTNKNFSFADGNAASWNTNFFWSLKRLKSLPWDVLNRPGSTSWNEFTDGKRKANSEVLIYPKIEKSYFYKICLKSDKHYLHMKKIAKKYSIENKLEISPNLFF